jgi:hypothetical protein
MHIKLNNTFEFLRNDILKTTSNFNSYEVSFGSGKRNSIKKIEVSGKTIIIKSFKIPNLLNKFVYKYLRKSKAKRSYEYATKLLELEVKTPIPIAYIEKFSSFGLQQSYYISEFTDYDLTYRELIDQPDYQNHEIILREFTKFTFKLHEKGIQFLDHSPGNTLIVKNNGSYDFYLVDLNRMIFGKLNFNQRMKNFSRLNPTKEMVEIMSDEYAKLSGEKFEKVFNTMWKKNQQIQEKLQRKKRLKKKFLGKK